MKVEWFETDNFSTSPAYHTEEIHGVSVGIFRTEYKHINASDAPIERWGMTISFGMNHIPMRPAKNEAAAKRRAEAILAAIQGEG